MKLTQQIIFVFLSFALSTITSAQEHLIFAVDLIRHGDRTPTHNLPKSPYLWQEGLGELTPLGMQQEYMLGKELRHKYVDQYHLLPTSYDVKTINVRSTDSNRTLMSAESFLLGLYPLGTGPTTLPARYQPIPIHTVPINEDSLLAVKFSKNIYSLAKLYFSTKRIWNEKTKPIQEKINRWSAATGLNLNDFRKFGMLSDNLYIRKIHHVPFPEGISASDADEIISLGNWATTTAFKFKAISYPTGHQVLTSIETYFENAAHQKDQLKYVLLSGHDSTIMSVMNTLGNPVDTIPPYASDLNFSLYENNQQYFVKVTFNHTLVNLPGCEKGICSLTQFAEIAD